MFVDLAKITVKSGDGGDGAVAFHREKYVARGGPDGGDGGKGGDVIFVTDPTLRTLLDFRYKHKFFAGSGAQGSGNRCTGNNGEDMVIAVPPGTQVRLAEDGRLVADMTQPGRRVKLLVGGRGGKGNARFATPTRQAPNFAQPGVKTRSYDLVLEMKSIADVGLVGLPNAGKSTLLSAVSAARPKIADYPFTTLTPQLGVVKVDDTGFTMADIPGLIEDASQGAGLGHDFLRHVERNRLLLHVVDMSGFEGRDPLDDVAVIEKELEAYDPLLARRPRILVANKMDVGQEAEDNLARLKAAKPDALIFPISAVIGEGVKELLRQVVKELNALPVEEPEEIPEEELQATLDDSMRVLKVGDMLCVDGPGAERLLASVNLYDRDSMTRFQRMLDEKGILDQLRALGAKDGDSIQFCDTEFDFVE